MKKPARGSGSGRRQGHGDDDHAVWESVASTIKPIGKKSRVHPAVDAASERTSSRSGKAAVPRQIAPYVPPLPPPETAPPLADFDQKRAKRIRSGRVEIERRIDLHGMRRTEAHSVLRRFLLDCYAQGRRSVLVITGKGDPRRRRDDDFNWGRDEPGVLKREVPQWLAEPELRAIVVSFTAAAIQHGGEGALYVHLRRQRGAD